MQDLWHVGVTLRYQEWESTVFARYILRTDSPVEAAEAASIACVQVMYRTGLPNGEHAYAIDGTAFRYQDGNMVARCNHTLVWDKDAKSYRHKNIKGEVVGPDPDDAEMIQYNWQHKRWDGRSG